MNDIAGSADSNAQQVTWRMALVFPTEEAMKLLNQHVEKTNAILHVTC